jgi:thiol-disulfide isomerase/thioredoxin
MRRGRQWSWLMWALFLVGPCHAVGGPAVLSLLKPLDLVGYRSGTAPPDFSGGTIGAQRFSLTAHRGKVILVNFWASWCAECRPEMPVLERLHRELARHGLDVVGVNVRESKDTVSRYAKDLDLTFPLVLDPEGKIGALYGVVGLPTTFLVGRDGRAVAFAIGPREWASAPARALLAALLAESAPQPSPE